MTLTMPTSRRDPGRAARPVAREAGGAAGAVADLGQAVQRVGLEYQQQALAYQGQRAQSDYMRELGDLRLSIEEIGDPDQKAQAWDQGASEIRGRYFGEDSALDPRLRQRLAPEFDNLAYQHSFAIGQDVIAGRRSRAEALWIDHSLAVANQAAVVGGEARDELLGQSFDMLDELVASNVITAEEAARRRLALIGEVDNATASRVLATDPQAALEMAERGDFDSLGPEARQGIVNKANAAIAKAAEDEAAAREKAVGRRLDEIAAIYLDNGLPPLDAAWLNTPEAKAHPDYGKAMAAKRAYDAGLDLKTMTPDEIAAEIERERKSGGVVFKYQNDYLQTLEAGLEEAEKAWSTDPLAAARDRLGLEVPPLPLAGEPGELAVALVERAALSDELNTRGFTEGLTLLSDEDRAALESAIGVEADPADRARLAGEIATGLLGRQGALAQVSDDPVFGLVGSMLAAGGSRRVAEEVFRGQQVIAHKTALLPPQKDRTAQAFEELQTIFADVPGGEALEGAVVQAADALYARRMRLEGPTDDIDTDVYAQALHEVLGGTGTFDARDARGGVQVVRDRLTLLPIGVNGRAVEEALGRVGVGYREYRSGDRVRALPDYDPEVFVRQLTAAAVPLPGRSASGWEAQAPRYLSRPLTLEDWDDVQIKPVGGDVFTLVIEQGGEARVLTREDGEDYTFNLRRLMREVRR